MNSTFSKIVLKIISFLWRWCDYYKLFTKFWCFLIAFICKYVLEWYLWPLRLADFSACHTRDPGFFSIPQEYGSGYYFASRVYKSNNFWLVSIVSLVESESGVPLQSPTIVRWTRELEHDINKFCFKGRTIFFFFFTVGCYTLEIRHGARELSPVFCVSFCLVYNTLLLFWFVLFRFALLFVCLFYGLHLVLFFILLCSSFCLVLFYFALLFCFI